jgi:low density lipoprotein-related protein 2
VSIRFAVKLRILSVPDADHSAAFLIISNRHSILVADLKEQGLERVPIIVENVVATASNMHTGTIFWSDMKLKKISRLDRGSEPQEVSFCEPVLMN